MRGDIVRQQWNVGGRQGVFLRLLRRDPDQRRVAMQLQFTGELRDSPGMQPDEAFALLPLIAAHMLADTGANPQLFIQLARQRLWLAFAGFNLAAGKLPQTGLIAACAALGQQNAAVLFQNGGYHVDNFHWLHRVKPRRAPG